jgi:hypothetical protein
MHRPRHLIAGAVLTMAALSCQPGAKGRRLWATLPDSAALRLCRDSLAGGRDGHCRATSPGGQQLLMRDAQRGGESMVRYWYHAPAAARDAYSAQRRTIEAELGPGHACAGDLRVWRIGKEAVVLNLLPPDTPADRAAGRWRVVVGLEAGASPGYQFLCPGLGAA